MIVEKQNNAAGVQFKMLTMREISLRGRDGGREERIHCRGVDCGKLHALYKLKPQALNGTARMGPGHVHGWE